MKKELRALISDSNKIKNEIISWRRHFHKYPELSGKEVRTAAKIASELSRLGIRVRTKVGGTGVLGIIEGKEKKRYVALRADMDALPVEEKINAGYKSETPGVAHLCGHDGHMAMLLGAAKLLAARKKDLSRGVKFIFQPAEEKAPGGALGMIKAGVLNQVEEIFALHLFSTPAAGLIQTRPAALMASPATFTITVRGKGGHAAMPHLTLDPIPVAAEIITALQTVVTREIDPIDNSVISVTKISGGTTHNAIPDEVQMMGTVRTLSKNPARQIPKAMERKIKKITESAGMKYEFTYSQDYPVLENHPASTQKAAEIARAMFGPKKLDYPCKPLMTGEDFAYYLQKVSGAFIFIGARKGNLDYPNHNPKFQIDENVLPLGTAYLAALALS